METRDMRVLEGGAVPWDEGGPARQLVPAPGFKTCPQCGALVFEDMDTCYGCLFSFAEAEAEDSLTGSWDPVWLEGGLATLGDGLGALEEPEEEPQQPAGVAQAEPVPEEWAGVSVDPQPSVPDAEATCDLGALLGPAPRWAVRLAWRGLEGLLELPASGVTIGRAPDNNLVLPPQYVSRRHAAIRPDGADVVVEDLGARNPTVLAGQPVVGRVVWPPGAVLEVCDAKFSLVQLDPREADAIVNGRF